MRQQLQLAVDAGQSSTRIRVVGPEARDLVAPGVDTSRDLYPQWARLIIDTLDGLDADADVVALGSTGLGAETALHLMPLLEGRVRRLLLAHDSVTSYLGALGDDTGCVIAAGTGTICLAVGPSRVARVDGWGNLVGDAGSAYWIGRTGMEAALRGYDGRRQMTALTASMEELFDDIETAYLELQHDPDRVARIASFAREVSRLSMSDRVAHTIMEKAAAHLSEAVQAAVRRAALDVSQPPRVAALGGVFGSELICRRFTDYLSLQWPTFALVEPLGEGIDGAEAMLSLASDHPLRGRLSGAQH